jgi:hypothetical protein
VGEGIAVAHPLSESSDSEANMGQLSFFNQPAAAPRLTQLFRLDEGWRGPVRLLSFLGGGQISQAIPARARFGENILLDSIDLLDSVSHPDGIVRARLNWYALGRVHALHVVCAHIFNADQIVAQHYGQPAADTRPTNTWRYGDSITDPFALRLFDYAPPGLYCLRVALLDLDTESRVPVYEPNGEAADYFIGGQIVVQ